MTTPTAPRYRISKLDADDPITVDGRFRWYYTGADDNEARDYGTVETFDRAVALVAEDDARWIAEDHAPPAVSSYRITWHLAGDRTPRTWPLTVLGTLTAETARDLIAGMIELDLAVVVVEDVELVDTIAA